jgi:ABC-type phosphate transport system substrate-binding protein
MKRILFGLLMAALFAPASTVQAQEFQVVVNAGSSFSEISKGDLSKIFQKKARKLPSGEGAKPVDQKKDAAVREAFSEAVHGRSAGQIESYWQQQIFSGKDVPPEKKDSDAAVIDFVRSHPGAIGYVSAGASLGDGVKAVAVSD